MKNTLYDLNNYLFEAIERLQDASDEQLEHEIMRCDAVTKVAEKIIDNGELAFKTMKHLDDYGMSQGAPAMLSMKDDQ